MNKVDASCGENLLDLRETRKLRETCKTEIDKLKEAGKNPLMKHEIRTKCKARIVFLEKNLGLLEKIFYARFFRR